MVRRPIRSAGLATRLAAASLALASIAWPAGCKVKDVSADLDGGTGDASSEGGSDFAPWVPKSATLPGDFSPPKDPLTHAPEADVKPQWFGFEAFPGAQLLCSETVAAAPTGKLREIHWATYGVATPASEVIAFYKRRDAGALELDRDETTFVVGKAHRLSVVRLPTTQPYPRCDKPPKPTYKAVVVVSEATAK